MAAKCCGNGSDRVKRLALVLLISALAAACSGAPQASPTAAPISAPAKTAVQPTSTPAPAATAEPTRQATAVEQVGATPQPAQATPTAAAVSGQPVAQLVEVQFIDVGQGDAILIRAGPETMLIDGGDRSPGVVAYLKAQGITRLDKVLATHTHADHIGGLIEVFEQFEVGEAILNGDEHTTRTFEDLIDAIADSRAEYREVKRGDTIRLGGLTLRVLNPGPLTDDANNNSIVLALRHGSVSFLFMGDAEAEAEQNIFLSSIWHPSATILKLGHHGSRTSTTDAFLNVLQPEVAVYSAGEGNSYGHPHPETLAKLETAGVEVYGTDVHGTIVVRSDGQGYQVMTSGQGLPRAPPAAAPAPVPAPTTAPAPAAAAPGYEPCQPGQIKGNRNSGIYHVPGGASYARTYANVECLNTEAEAQAAGYRRAQR